MIHPGKSNIWNPKNGGLVQMIVLLKGWFSGSMVVFNCVFYEKRLLCMIL